LGIPQCVVHSLYRSSTRGPEDDSVESKHVAHYNIMCLILPLLCLTELHPPFISCLEINEYKSLA